MKTILAALAATTALAAPAFAENHAISEFRIGILGGDNVQSRLNNYQCFADYISEELGVEVKLFTPADYNGVIQGFLGGTLDLAWFGASAYAALYLQDPEAGEPFAVKTNLDGSYSYHSIGFARKDSGVTKIEDLEGKVFGFGDPNSTSGYLIPSVEIPAQFGVTMESGDFFGEVKFVGGHEQTIVAVYNGDIDAGVTWADGLGNWEDGYNSGALRRAVDNGLVDMNELVEIWTSKPIPEGPVTIRKDLPADVKEKVQALVLGLYAKDQDCAYNVAFGETAGFEPISHEAYETIIAVRKAKVDG
ncbi:phosphonate ABC transporter substrate-binding protein [Antarctobacter heliothermus]|uniref:Phosphonate transport system substrate-binding protein n=1 Tax=Antarctobacter heliothermus TaxID=74033 RepID=A0A239KNU1_9RHOB|nr:phosphonate ABC transporter substrate-binding protein [Antarctobacter heliothermus]SNT19700.1 phosphonate transport system substrate-binding protein [Antarctobacter heliothermus]